MTTLAEILAQLEEEMNLNLGMPLVKKRLQALIRVIRVLERQLDAAGEDIFLGDPDGAEKLASWTWGKNQECLNAYKGENGGGL